MIWVNDMNKKDIGEYYTPNDLVKNMVYAIKNELNNSEILEPSAGDGRFIKYLNQFKVKRIDSIELFKEKCDYIKKRYDKSNVEVINKDFLEYSISTNKKYDIIIGNPPYIKKTKISSEQLKNSNKLKEVLDCKNIKVENMWVSFILGALNLLKKNGVIFFVLPFEFLQVNYSEELRLFLEKKINKIEITVFNKKVFPDIEQDVCLLYMTNDLNFDKEYIKYKIVEDDKNINKIIYESKIMKNKPLRKWTNSIISDKETEMLKKIINKFSKINEFGNISPGIVTGNNNYFIKNEEFIKLTKSTNLPIISKSVLIGNKLLFEKKDFNKLIKEEKSVFLLKLTNSDSLVSDALKKYIKIGETKKYHKSYKCSTHKPWYNVPIIEKGDLLFFKRYHVLPRLVVNNANVYTTDISYNIRLKEKYEKCSFAFCFYNSLTLTMCEYYGRFYGGGVCELIPTEFKSLPIPYTIVDLKSIKKLDYMIKNNFSVEEITNFVDNLVLKEILSDEEIANLHIIRSRLISRRIK